MELNVREALETIKVCTGWSNETLGRKLRVSFTTIYRWQSGRVVPTDKAKSRIEALARKATQIGDAEVKQDRTYAAYSLFSGGGGFDLGLSRAGFRSVVATDIEPTAEKTHKRNWPRVPFLLDDISNVSGQQLLDLANGVKPVLIHGGPPCQGFSHLGGRLSADPRNQLFRQFARIAEELQPQCILLENVRSIFSLYNGRFAQGILDMFCDLGFTMFKVTLNAADYGVPQLRERAFFFGTRLDAPFSFPEPTHGPARLAYQTVGAAIMDLVGYEGSVHNHMVLNHSDIVVGRYQLIPEGGMLPSPDEIPAELRRKNFGNTYKRLHREKPSLTMVPGNNAFPVHPTLDRSLTPREAARIQSFPDDYVFEGDRRAQCKLAGNAVPPKLAESLGRSIARNLRKEIPSADTTAPAALGRQKTQNGQRTPKLLRESLNDMSVDQGFVDLFSGVGGITLGLGRAGWRPVLSVDNWIRAGKTHEHDFPNSPFRLLDLAQNTALDTIRRHVEDMGNTPIGILAGGPPCQGFSVFGHRHMTSTAGYDPHIDPRNRLVFAFLEAARILKPRWVLMENVPGLASLDSGYFLDFLLDSFRDIGYNNVEARIINCADYGVPQLRKRIIILGNRTGHIIPWPKRKFFSEPEDWQQPYATVGQHITDLADEKAYSKHTCHVPMKHRERQVERYKYIPEGGKLNVDELPDYLKQGYRTDCVKNYSHIFKRLHRNKPAPTMVPGHNAFPIHPWLNRSLTVREAARIQTLPDEMEFFGARECQCIQVGNAFPPMVAELLGNCIRKAEANDWRPGQVSDSAYRTWLEPIEMEQLDILAVEGVL